MNNAVMRELFVFFCMQELGGSMLHLHTLSHVQQTWRCLVRGNNSLLMNFEPSAAMTSRMASSRSEDWRSLVARSKPTNLKSVCETSSQVDFGYLLDST